MYEYRRRGRRLRKDPSKIPPREVGDLLQRHFKIGDAPAASRYLIYNDAVPLNVIQNMVAYHVYPPYS